MKIVVLAFSLGTISFGAVPTFQQSVLDIQQVLAYQAPGYEMERQLVSIVRTDRTIVEISLDCLRTSEISLLQTLPGSPGLSKINVDKPVCKAIVGKSGGYGTSIAELNAVLGEKELAKLIYGPVTSIARSAGGYLIATDACFVHAEVRGDSGGSPSFLVTFGKPQCK